MNSPKRFPNRSVNLFVLQLRYLIQLIGYIMASWGWHPVKAHFDLWSGSLRLNIIFVKRSVSLRLKLRL